jgi:hypothetical protein
MPTPAEPIRDSSSDTTMVWPQSPPWPPTSTGYRTPVRPSSPARLKTQSGKYPSASQSSECGASSDSTHSRTIARSASWSSVKRGCR